MKAIVPDKYGSPDALDLREIDRRAVDADSVLVWVRAASVNAFDWHIEEAAAYRWWDTPPYRAFAIRGRFNQGSGSSSMVRGHAQGKSRHHGVTRVSRWAPIAETPLTRPV